MRIEHVCQRCRAILGIIERTGGQGGSFPSMAMMHMESGRQGVCPRCGGWVYAVTEGQELPVLFHMTASRLTLVALSSAAMWFFFVLMAAWIGIAQPPGEPKEADTAALETALQRFSVQLALLGAAMGAVLPLFLGFLASKRDDINAPFESGAMSSGQMVVAGISWLVAIPLTVALTTGIASALVPEELPLRSNAIRAGIGLIEGFLVGTWSQMILFKICRR